MAKIPKSKKKKIKQLAHLMNKTSSFSLPIIGSLYRVFDLAMNEEEMDLLLSLGVDSLTKSQLLERSNLSDAKFDQLVSSLITKGILWSRPNASNEGEDLFELPPIMLGWVEAFFWNGETTPTKEKIAKAILNYFDTFKKLNFPIGRSLVNMFYKFRGPHWNVVAIEPKKKLVDVDEEVKVPKSKIMNTSTVLDLIEEYGNEDNMALTHCLCRQAQAINGEPCRLNLPVESHIWVGDFARHAIKHDIGRPISKQEALELMEEVRQKGGVHEIMHEGMDLDEPDLAICSCCWDCCTVLGGWARSQTPFYVETEALASLEEPESCTGCGTCVNICPVEAITIVSDIAVHEEDHCIGCGLCEFHCPNDAVRMLPNKRSVFLPLKKKSEDRTLST